MRIPEQIPGLKPAAWLLGVYTVIWISLEGVLWRSLLLGVAVTLLCLAYVTQRRLGGHTISLAKSIVAAGLWGAVAGLCSGLLTLLFMSLKTGLHAHGPEFTVQEIGWVLRQIPWWGLAGLSLGLGLALLIWSRR
jgi:hypothetical protein